jgi:hypothetical protein
LGQQATATAEHAASVDLYFFAYISFFFSFDALLYYIFRFGPSTYAFWSDKLNRFEFLLS